MTGFTGFCPRFLATRGGSASAVIIFWRPDGSARSSRADSDLRESREIEKSTAWSKKALSSQTSTRAFPVTNPWEFMAVYVLYSEFLNFFVWLCVEIKILRRVRAES